MIFSSQPLHVDRLDFAYSTVKSFSASVAAPPPAAAPASEEAVYNMNVYLKYEKHTR
jgi:hypothetical protein